jgi:hypothetical protein
MTTKINDSRLKELEAIDLKKSKMPKFPTQKIRINHYTHIEVRIGKDPIKAKENFILKTSDEYRSKAVKRPKN